MSTLRQRLLAENKRILRKGERQGIEQGIKQGIEQGIKQGKIEVVKNMINKKMDDKIIIEIAEIDKEELEKIKNTLALIS